MSDYARRDRQRTAGADFFSRLVACFLGTLFGTLISGVLLLLIVRAYLHWSVKSTVDEMNQKAEEERKKPPPTFPRFEWPKPDPDPAPATRKK